MIIWFCLDMAALYFAIKAQPFNAWNWFVFMAFCTVQAGLHEIHDQVKKK